MTIEDIFVIISYVVKINYRNMFTYIYIIYLPKRHKWNRQNIEPRCGQCSKLNVGKLEWVSLIFGTSARVGFIRNLNSYATQECGTT